MMVSKDKTYSLYSYEGKEHELQNVVEERATEIFGPNSFYISKRKLMSKKMEIETVPDGFVLDVSDPENPIFHLVEIELKTHGLEHIATQILKFAISYGESKSKLIRVIKESIRADSELQKKIEERLKDSRQFKHLDQLLDKATDEDTPNVLVPIDGLEPSLKEVQKYIRVPINYLPIQTYIETESGERIHQFTPLGAYQEEDAARKTEVGTWYDFLLTNSELINTPRPKFDSEHNISKQAQGYTFIRDQSGEPTGVVFWWYRSRMERHIKEELRDGQTRAGTRRPVDPDSYRVGMDVYIGETLWDRDTGQRVEDAKYRIHGKLKEIYRVDGQKRTKIFPTES